MFHASIKIERTLVGLHEGLSMANTLDTFGARDTLNVGDRKVTYYRLSRLQELGIGNIDSLPYSIKILLENALRHLDGFAVTENDVRNIAGWDPRITDKAEIPFMPARVVLQDFTGVPCV